MTVAKPGFIILCLILIPLYAAAERRIVSVQPAASKWTVNLEGIDDPVFMVDGETVPGTRVDSLDGAGVFELTGIPDGAWRLAVARKGKEELAVRVGVHSEEAAPYNEWVVYHIMMAYFRNGSRGNDKASMRRWIHKNYAGGDLQGLREKVDYLADLGVNAVWLSPLFESETSHGYDVKNYWAVGAAMAVPGDKEASLEVFRDVVKALHERGIRVVLDLPLNHGSLAYDKRAGDPHNRRPKHTKARQEAEKMWDSWNAGFRYWNFKNESTRTFLKEAALYWLVDEDVDGLRMDYVRGIPHDFWAELYSDVKETKPGAYIFGEAWQDAGSVGANAVDTALYYRDAPDGGPQFDSLLDYPLQMTMNQAFARGGNAADLEYWLQRTAALYGTHGRPLYFIDNHDVARFLAWTDDRGEDRLMAALGYMASLSSPFVIFYGTETGIRGGSPKPGFIDNGREPMPWDSLDTALIERVSRLLAVRSEHPALTRGGRLPLHVDDKTLVMLKTHPEGDVLVGVNTSGREHTVSISAGELFPTGAVYENVLEGTAPVVNSDGELTWTLPPHGTNWAVRSGGDDGSE